MSQGYSQPHMMAPSMLREQSPPPIMQSSTIPSMIQRQSSRVAEFIPRKLSTSRLQSPLPETSGVDTNSKSKYLKYKKKYLELKKLLTTF